MLLRLNHPGSSFLYRSWLSNSTSGKFNLSFDRVGWQSQQCSRPNSIRRENEMRFYTLPSLKSRPNDKHLGQLLDYGQWQTKIYRTFAKTCAAQLNFRIDQNLGMYHFLVSVKNPAETSFVRGFPVSTLPR